MEGNSGCVPGNVRITHGIPGAVSTTVSSAPTSFARLLNHAVQDSVNTTSTAGDYFYMLAVFP